MVLTFRDMRVITGKAVRTVGKYSTTEVQCRKAYCKCAHEHDSYAEHCRACDRRIRI